MDVYACLVNLSVEACQSCYYCPAYKWCRLEAVAVALLELSLDAELVDI